MSSATAGPPATSSPTSTARAFAASRVLRVFIVSSLQTSVQSNGSAGRRAPGIAPRFVAPAATGAIIVHRACATLRIVADEAAGRVRAPPAGAGGNPLARENA